MTLTRDRKSALLAAARLFDGVDADGMDRIAAVAVEVEFPADHVIARNQVRRLGRYLHAATRMLARGFAQRGLFGMFAQRVVEQVLVKRVVEVDRAA